MAPEYYADPVEDWMLCMRCRKRPLPLLSAQAQTPAPMSTATCAGAAAGGLAGAALSWSPAASLPRAPLHVSQGVELVLAQVFNAPEFRAGLGHRVNQLVQLELHRLRAAVLAVLNEEHYQEGDYGSARVNHELPGRREAEKRSCNCPDNNYNHRKEERPRGTDSRRYQLR